MTTPQLRMVKIRRTDATVITGNVDKLGLLHSAILESCLAASCKLNMHDSGILFLNITPKRNEKTNVSTEKLVHKCP